jgi:uncharacterized protein
MPKIGYLIIILIIGLLIYLKYPRKVTKIIDQKIANQNFTLEIADNIYLLAKGLSNRGELCQNCGMLFIFNWETTQTFWMKDTLISLDIIFINKSGLITDIYTASPEPNKNDFQLTLYQSTAPSQYVIELNAGTSKKLGLKKDDQINLNL